ncbi:MAG: UDP-N-acetylmuramate dehydrogenase [candidate division WOR-3 bacterium]
MKEIFTGINGIKVLTDEPLSNYTSFRIGGDARYLIKVYNQSALIELMKVIENKRLNYLTLGEGTNILFRDRGFDGVIIKLMGKFRRIKNNGNIFFCGGGALIKNFVNKAMEKGYTGMEFLAGIPGSIGGAIKGNAGAFGRSISDILCWINIFEPGSEIRIMQREEIKFDYRYSDIADNAIILEAEFRLKKGERGVIKRKINEFLKIRKQKQPRGASAGSFFKNPKPLSAGRLIDECGLKGLRVGDAIISKKHANFIINLGKASAQDVIRIMNVVKRRVKELKGIDLEPEVRIV